MHFASDNTAPAAPEVLDAVVAANRGFAPGYGNDDWTRAAQDAVRAAFEAPQASVHFVATGTAANALALACLCPPWGAVVCESLAHINSDECGAPEMFTAGAKLVGVAGRHGRLAPDDVAAALDGLAAIGVHSVQRGALSLTNVTEAGTVYAPGDIAALAAVARARGVPVHLDGARIANALAATGATPAEMTWRAGVDVLSLGGTKDGLVGSEAVVVFDPARDWELQLRRKRAGHLFSKMRYLSAQFPAWLQGGLWLRLAGQANAMAARLAAGLAGLPGVDLQHPVQANILFVTWPAGTAARLRAAGAVFYDWTPPGDGREAARLVTSWCTTAAEVDGFLAAMAGR
jgi:threonine aldolase